MKWRQYYAKVTQKAGLTYTVLNVTAFTKYSVQTYQLLYSLFFIKYSECNKKYKLLISNYKQTIHRNRKQNMRLSKSN